MSLACIKYDCTVHSSGVSELNAHCCYVELDAIECRHIIKFVSAIKVDPIWKDLQLSCVLNKENLCVETIESYYNASPILCPISYLRSDTGLSLIVNCIKKIISVLSDLDERGWAIVGSTKFASLHKTLCNILLNVCSDGTVIFTHKYLLTKKSKNCLSILPKAMLYFLCRETKVPQKQCSMTDCRLKRQQAYFVNIDEHLLHRCFCGPTESMKCTDFQRMNIIDVFGAIE